MQVYPLTKTHKWLISGLVLTNCFAWLFLKPELQTLISLIHHGEQIPKTISLLLPRLKTEILRHPIDFFTIKVTQVFIRFSIVSFAAILIYPTINRINTRTVKANRLWNAIRLFHLSLTVISFPWLLEIPQLTSLTNFYSPAGILNIFQTLPSYYFLTAGIYLFHILNLIAVFKPQKLIPSILISLLFIYNYGLIQSFGKTDHGYSTIVYSLLLTPFLRLQKVNLGGLLFFIQLVITGYYFMAGLEKLTISGFNWLNGSTIQFYLKMSSNSIAQMISTQTWLCILISVFVIAFQTGFIFSLTRKKQKIRFMISGIAFHWGITFLMGISNFIINPWLMSYILLLPQTKKELK